MREWTLPQGARPHSIAADRNGNIWYMGNANGTVGKLEPKTGEITVYILPDPAARDPHTPIFDRNGILWFTVQNGNMVGRLNPANGEIKLAKVPHARRGSVRPGYRLQGCALGRLHGFVQGGEHRSGDDGHPVSSRFRTRSHGSAGWRSPATT